MLGCTAHIFKTQEWWFLTRRRRIFFQLRVGRVDARRTRARLVGRQSRTSEGRRLSVQRRRHSFILQTRYLIAEYVRSSHHLRVIDLLQDQSTLLSNADLGDTSLRKTIVDVCVSHGLSRTDLAMDERYPTRRDIQGDPVDVRFMAVFSAWEICLIYRMIEDALCSLMPPVLCRLGALPIGRNINGSFTV